MLKQTKWGGVSNDVPFLFLVNFYTGEPDRGSPASELKWDFNL